MELSFENVSVMRGGRRVLDDVGAVLRPGRVTAILGPNGAGKSSLVKAAAALLPFAGGIRIGADEVTALPPRTRARRIGYLPQDATVQWNVPVAEMVLLGRMPHRAPFAAPSEADRNAVRAAMAATDTIHLADRAIGTLSGGERARVLLARVLAGEPQWLLTDEPLASLDPAHQIDMLDRLADVARTGAGVAIVLHDLLHAGRIADDILLLKEGRVLAFGPARGVLTPAILARAYEIEVDVSEGADGRLRCVPLGRISRGAEPR